MITATTTERISTLPFQNLFSFLVGFMRARPSVENPYWIQVKKIIENRADEFFDEFNTRDFKEIIKIIFDQAKNI
jgi:hypothetical protein